MFPSLLHLALSCPIAARLAFTAAIISADIFLFFAVPRNVLLRLDRHRLACNGPLQVDQEFQP